MGRKFYLLIILALSLFSASAQSGSKLDKHLLNLLKQDKIDDGNIALLVKGDLNKIKALTKQMGGVYKYGYGSVASVAIPKKNLITFSNDMSIKKIESTMAKGVALMDTARIRNNIDSAQAGFAPLQDSLLGKNVIVGIIDGGIYWQHQDFKNADGTTRILYIWDQIVTAGVAPLPYNYGTEWNSTEINQGTCTEVEAYGQNNCASDFGHGTCVAGIASGNGSSWQNDSALRGVYTGVAPQSNLIVVDIGTSGACMPNTLNFLSQIADAVDYIFKKADALGMPCVINISQGTYYGSHDGKDITAEIIDSLLSQRNGRCVVAAAGNAGNIPFHLGYTLSADTANPTYTLFKYNSSGGYVYYDLWADTANFNNAWFSFGVTDNIGNPLGNLQYMNVLNDFQGITDGTPFSVNRPVVNGTLNLGLVAVTVTLDEARYHIEFEMDFPTNTQDLFTLQTNGSGRLDLWASTALMGTSDMITLVTAPPSDTMVLSHNYVNPDFNKTMVSSWQNSDKVITVGNYSNRAGYYDIDSTYIDLTAPNYGEVVGKRYLTSSFGPTRDNRVKPDIIATGSTIICTGDSNDIVATINGGNGFKVAWGKKDLRNGGTSMSSPIVAGIAALYFQKRPTATFDEIKKALICTAVTDSFTGPTPNGGYGYGKVNAFQALAHAGCIVYGATDTSCSNYNPLATIDTGGCNAKIYGVLDTACVNYNPLANTSSGNCVAKVYGCTDSTAANYDSLANISTNNCIYTSIANIPGASITLTAMPNPFTNQVTFSILNNGYNFKLGTIEITNALGEKVDVITIGSNTASYVYDNPKLAGGIYFYLLKLDNRVVKSGKLVAQ